MEIFEAAEDDFPKIQEFIRTWENSCVSLCSNIRRKKEHLYIIKNDDSQITGVFFLDKTLLHCIPNPIDSTELEHVLSAFLADKKITCISGELQSTQIILNALEKNSITPYHTNHYKLMVLKETPLPPPEELSCDDAIRRCTINDTETETLLSLQKMYMAKEVAPPGRQVTDLEATAQLKSILKDQLCFTLESDGEIVAKANTNAIGFNYVQLGGVYTHPLYRKNYYAWNLVYTICSRVIKTGRKISLFVKEKNNPAHTLYERIGFEECGQYEIAYFDGSQHTL